jgi:DNA (cytosine-5)-methyltransferase 1
MVPSASNDELTAIDLFAGCGGLTAGLRAAGFRVVAAVEKDHDAAESYAANHKGVRLYREDICRVSPGGVLADLGMAPGEVDLIAGCPPCQGFTRLTENNAREDPRNGLVRQYLHYVREILPRACMLENVPGLTKRGKPFFVELCEGLEEAGYVVTHDVLELADYGVPQFRKRLVLLASREGRIAIPRPTHKKNRRTVKSVIGNLPSPPLRSEVVAGDVEPAYEWHYARDVAPVVRQRLEHALANGGSRTSLPRDLRLACHQRRPNGYYDVYGVMSWDAPSPTITSGCTNASKGRFGHPEEPRPLTAREAARLQTFPLNYKFKGSGLESVAAQIGNALPKRFAKVVGQAVARHLTAPA